LIALEQPVADVFSGSIPGIYETHLVPLIFDTYAADLAMRLRAHPLGSLLEVAAGTGVVTRALAQVLPDGASIVATDLNPAMLAQAQAVPTARPVEWRQADALQLPFSDGEFDVVVCQFGVMFFPDKVRGFSEFRRVLRRGGVLLFSVWDRLETNEFAYEVERGVASVFLADPPRFLSRAPYGYFDESVIVRDLSAAGFMPPAIDTVTARSRAESARGPALGFCQGTPLRNEIEARDASQLDAATDAAEQAVAARFGSGPVDARIQAHVVVVQG